MKDKYYDDKCPQCEQGCHYFGHGAFPNGTPYEKCDCYGYILHQFVDAPCSGYRTEEQWQKEQEIKKHRNKYKNK